MVPRCIFVVLLLAIALPAARPLSELLKPTGLVLDKEYIIVGEKTTVYVYSTKDFKLLRQFGKEGEGPQEFKQFVALRLSGDKLLVNSLGKLSIYTRDGRFIEEHRTRGDITSNLFYPLGRGYVGLASADDGKVMYQTIVLLDAAMANPRELLRLPMLDKARQSFQLLKRTPIFLTTGNRLYMTGAAGFNIEIRDSAGKPLSTIREQYARRPFTPADEKHWHEWLKATLGAQYEVMKQLLVFPGEYPEIMNMFIDGGRLYVFTWKRQGGKSEVYIYDLAGKFLRRTWVEAALDNEVALLPAAVYNGAFHQLRENPQSEEWELHSVPIH